MTAPNLKLTIAGSSHTGYLTPFSVNLYDNLDARTSLSFVLKQPTSVSRPIVGQPVYLYKDSTTLIFGGSLDNYVETCFPFTNELQIQCNCVDFTQMVGKRLVYKSYTSSGYDADIIKDINTNFLNGEGIDVATYVSTGITIPELNLNYIPANEVFNTICKLTGRSWYIDGNKKMHYFERTANTAPISLNSTSNNWRSLSVKRSRDQYRNKEYLYGVDNITDTKSEYFTGDGNTRTWMVSFPIYSTPSIWVDGFTASVGILGVSASTFGYYWHKESQTISQCTSNTVLASTDVLRVDYVGLYPIIAVTMSEDEIADRAAIEGNSGIYESADKQSKIYTATQAFDTGDSMINKYGEIAETVHFETDIDGLAAGQLIYINITNNSLDDYYLITDVTAKDISTSTMRYSVTATSGQDKGGWASYFRSLLRNDADPLGTPFDNTYQYTVRRSYGTIRFVDSGVSYVTYVIVAGLVDSAVVDVSMVWI